MPELILPVSSAIARVPTTSPATAQAIPTPTSCPMPLLSPPTSEAMNAFGERLRSMPTGTSVRQAIAPATTGRSSFSTPHTSTAIGTK